MNIHQQVAAFAAQWEKEQGYKPAAFQKAIAMPAKRFARSSTRLWRNGFETREREMTDNDIVPVVFRAERAGKFKGDVTAVFPTLPADVRGYEMTCYAHIGQHGGCSFEWYNSTRAARPDEYAALKRELESAPYEYRLKVCQRISSAMRRALRENAKN